MTLPSHSTLPLSFPPGYCHYILYTFIVMVGSIKMYSPSAFDKLMAYGTVQYLIVTTSRKVAASNTVVGQGSVTVLGLSLPLYILYCT